MKTFPMFLRMNDREVIIVGTGEEAAQKARLILKTEAKLTVIGPDLDDELAGLLDEGRISHQPEPASTERLSRATLVFAASGCPALDACTVDLAKTSGTLVNAVDQPDICEAFTPSIVDRDPVVVAIGTEGTAPVLARRIKSQLETMLPPTLGGFAALAGRLRAAVAQNVSCSQRRAFWRWAFDEPLSRHSAGAERDAARLLKQAISDGKAPDAVTKGSISLVGAGPGAADLMTLRAMRRLQEADVIFYDRLVGPDVLELARRDAERVYVGKAPGAHAWPQEKIDRFIVAEAKKGRTVVRLKGGDPSIFARAEEELRAAKEAGIPTEIVPGITAASAAACAVNRPLTERGQTSRLVLATATGEKGQALDSLSQDLRPGTTLAIYMGLRSAPEIQTRLLDDGLPPSMEVEIVSRASLPEETRLRTSLAGMARDIDSKGIDTPSVILLRHPVAQAQMVDFAQTA